MKPAERRDRRARRARWDERYREGDWLDARGPAEALVRAAPWLPREGRALDLACGAGRNALFLAERGLRVMAVDLSWEGLQRTARRARTVGRRGTALRILPVHADLERFAVRSGSVQVVVNTHFLLRSTFPRITDALAPGGLLVFETFNVDEIDLLGGDIRREFALERGELLEAFPDLEILDHEEGIVERPEGERGLTRLIARKPPRRGA